MIVFPFILTCYFTLHSLVSSFVLFNKHPVQQDVLRKIIHLRCYQMLQIPHSAFLVYSYFASRKRRSEVN